MRKLKPAQKLDLLLAHPYCQRTGPNSFTRKGGGGQTRRLHAMYSKLYPSEFIEITPAPDWSFYDVRYHEIGNEPAYFPLRCEVGIVCPVQVQRFEWAQETAALAADIVNTNLGRLAAISPCRVTSDPLGSAWCYISESWSREFKESVSEVYSWHNAWLAQLYTEHAAALEATPKCTSLQVQQQLDKAAALGGLRPDLAASWVAFTASPLAVLYAPREEVPQ